MNAEQISAWIRYLARAVPERYSLPVVIGILLGISIRAGMRLLGIALLDHEAISFGVLLTLIIAMISDRRSPQTGFRNRIAAVDMLFELGKLPLTERRQVVREILSRLTARDDVIIDRLNWRAVDVEAYQATAPRDANPHAVSRQSAPYSVGRTSECSASDSYAPDPPTSSSAPPPSDTLQSARSDALGSVSYSTASARTNDDDGSPD